MLYECPECQHLISADAWRCPNCGSKDAGEIAKGVYDECQHQLWEAAKDRNDPGWRSREKLQREAEYRERDANNNLDNFFWVYYFYLLPLLITGTAMLVAEPLYKLSGQNSLVSLWGWFMVIPLLNWITTVYFLFGGDGGHGAVSVVFHCSIFWIVVGCTLEVVTGRALVLVGRALVLVGVVAACCTWVIVNIIQESIFNSGGVNALFVLFIGPGFGFLAYLYISTLRKS